MPDYSLSGRCRLVYVLHVAHAFAIKTIFLKSLNHKIKFAVWTISYQSIMLKMMYCVKMNIMFMYLYNCITISADELCGLRRHTAGYEFDYLFTAIVYHCKYKENTVPAILQTGHFNFLK